MAREDDIDEAVARKIAESPELQEFFVRLGHRLRNPLGTISNAVALLERRSGKDPAISRLRDLLSREIKNVTAVLDDLANVGSEGARPERTPPSREEKTPARKRRVLVVDDQPDAVTTMAELLESLGHEVRVAIDGQAALSAVSRHSPDVVLLDIDLPTLDGYEVAKQIRDSLTGQSVLLIAVTGLGDDEHRRRSIESGFDHHLVKPVDFNTLQLLFG